MNAPPAPPATRWAALSVADRAVLLPATAVAEVVRLVNLAPREGAPPALAGRFVWRGEAVDAVDLGALLGGAPLAPPPLDAHLVVVAHAPPFALLVNRVQGVVEEAVPLAAPPEWPGSPAAVWDGQVQVGAETLPVIQPRAVARWLRERAA